jgi:phytoene dehydrogenase-like protein
MTQERSDIVVVGGGLAGLTAAITAARAGRSVTLLDGRSDLGGRARSELHDGFTFNQGAHALYRAGRARGVLRSFGIKPQGSMPRLRGSRLEREGQPLPLLSSNGVTIGGWSAISRHIHGPGALGRAEGLTAAEWIARCPSESGRDGLAALVRVSTYLADVEHADATEVLRQVRRAERGVLYLDGGWQQLVDALGDVAVTAGVRTIAGTKVESVESARTSVNVCHGGRTITAASVVIAAGGPGHADRLVGGASPTLSHWAINARPVVAACLDIALRRLPSQRRGLTLGLDQSTYLNLHTPAAKVAPDSGGEMLTLMRYSADSDPDGDHRAVLESLADAAYPGWREEVVHTQFGRRLIVAHDRPRPGVEPADRPSVAIPEIPNVFLAGDWITREGLLADAAMGSAVTAGHTAACVASGAPSPIPEGAAL